MQEPFRVRRGNGRSFCVLWLFAVTGCSAADPTPRRSQQLGNGTPTTSTGEGGTTNVENGGASGNAGARGSGGTVGGISGRGGAIGTGGAGVGNTTGSGGASAGTGGAFGVGGNFGTGGAGNSTGGISGAGGQIPGAGGAIGAGGASNAEGETGRLIGMTAAHNAVRADVQTQNPLPPMTWSQTLADYAQSWADTQATTSCANPQHRSETDLGKKGYGENLATFGSPSGGSTAEDAVNAWAAEAACWTYGTIAGTEQCNQSCYSALNSDGCGHYTQIVWRSSVLVGCGVASCKQGNLTTDIWICNYSPAGNFQGETPY